MLLDLEEEPWRHVLLKRMRERPLAETMRTRTAKAQRRQSLDG